ncbi:PLD nuclease N-terminal domain-containing protein [Nafulsella turpanensis]|uniref:PLD nuclease N-terminal domain-containing protein n=1 Tax=Nafulsella turpanensis TaxID=1265690 RepID=UPI00034745BD|nr:PLD nuclease N-terminal domain-containing protein [Nafulsella turpanensis]
MILLQDDFSWLLELGFVAIIIGIVLLLIWIWAIIDILKRPMNGLMKLIWIALVIFLPFLGVLLYLFFGRATNNTPPTRNNRY